VVLCARSSRIAERDREHSGEEEKARHADLLPPPIRKACDLTRYNASIDAARNALVSPI
jgi:hypothetical protein